MPKRESNTITLGSGEFYVAEFGETMPTVEQLCVSNNLLGHTKGGAALTYTGELYEETDDLGRVQKTIITKEEVILKGGILTWNGETLGKLVDRCKITASGGRRTVKLGGAGNAQGKVYAICFFHEDKADGNLWILLKGSNKAGITLTFATTGGTTVDPEFKAMPQDEDGTLVQLIEETGEK